MSHVYLTAPTFRGPTVDYTHTDPSYIAYFFSCEVAAGDDTSIKYDVVLLFNGKPDDSLQVKTATVAQPKRFFSPSDFGTNFGKHVRY